MTDSTVDFNDDDIANDIAGLDLGQGEDFSNNTGPVQPDTTQEANQQPQDEPQEIVDNPAWKPYLDKFDPSVHGQLREVLSDLDARTQRRFERQAELEKNYGQFAQSGVSPQMLQAGYQLFQNLNNDPQSFYQKLGESLGITPQQAEQMVNGEEDEEIDPQQAKIQQQLDQMQQYLESQQQLQEQQRYQQAVQEEESRLDQDIQKVRSQYNLSDSDMRGVIQRTLFLTQTNPAATLYDGLQEMLNERRAWEQSRPTNSAPSVLSGNGTGTVAPQTNFADKSEKDQNAELAALIENLGR